MKYTLPHSPTRRHLGPYLSPWYVTLSVSRSVDLGRANNRGIIARPLLSSVPRLRRPPKASKTVTGCGNLIYSNRPR